MRKKNGSGMGRNQKEKLKLIGEILEYYFERYPPNGSPYFYGETFDKFYDKDLNELKLRLTVYNASKDKFYVK